MSKLLFPKEKEKEIKKKLVESLILYKMNSENKEFPIMLELENTPLQPVFQNLLRDEMVEIKKTDFSITLKGNDFVTNFEKYYKRYLADLDVYCAVDLDAGEFAFEKVDQFKDDEKAWQSYLHGERFEDLRIPICEYLGLPTYFIMFLSFLKEGRFSHHMKKNGWQYDLMLGSFWDDLEKIFNTSLTVAQLGYNTENNEIVKGESVIADILEKGQQICANINRNHFSITMDKKAYKDIWEDFF